MRIYEKIIEGRISFPEWIPPEVKDIVQQLCNKDLSARLGNMKGGGYEVMRHPFFKGIDWRELERQVQEVGFGHLCWTFLLTNPLRRVQWCRIFVTLEIQDILTSTIHRGRVQTMSIPKKCPWSMICFLRVFSNLFNYPCLVFLVHPSQRDYM